MDHILIWTYRVFCAVDCNVTNETKHAPDCSMVRTRLLLKPLRLSTRQTIIDTSKLKNALLAALRSRLRNQFERLELNGNAFSEENRKSPRVVSTQRAPNHWDVKKLTMSLSADGCGRDQKGDG